MNAAMLTTSCTGRSGAIIAGIVPLAKRKKDASGLTTAAVSATEPATAPSGAFFTTGFCLSTAYNDDGGRFLRKYVPIPVDRKIELYREEILSLGERRYFAGVTCE